MSTCKEDGCEFPVRHEGERCRACAQRLAMEGSKRWARRRLDEKLARAEERRDG